jgi:hypothetical protein
LLRSARNDGVVRCPDSSRHCEAQSAEAIQTGQSLYRIASPCGLAITDTPVGGQFPLVRGQAPPGGDRHHLAGSGTARRGQTPLAGVRHHPPGDRPRCQGTGTCSWGQAPPGGDRPLLPGSGTARRGQPPYAFT